MLTWEQRRLWGCAPRNRWERFAFRWLTVSQLKFYALLLLTLVVLFCSSCYRVTDTESRAMKAHPGKLTDLRGRSWDCVDVSVWYRNTVAFCDLRGGGSVAVGGVYTVEWPAN